VLTILTIIALVVVIGLFISTICVIGGLDFFTWLCVFPMITDFFGSVIRSILDQLG
jgi:hypothetical protein